MMLPGGHQFCQILCVVAILVVVPQVWVLAQTVHHNGHEKNGYQKIDSHNSFTEMAAASRGGPRRWHVIHPKGVTLYKTPVIDGPIIKTLPDGALLSNLGCTQAGQALWCAVQPIRGRERGYVMAEFLNPVQASDETILMGVDDSRSRAFRGDFDAKGRIPCAQVRNQMMETCLFGVARANGGDATVVVTFTNGFKRMLFFTNAAFVSANTTMSGTGFDIDWVIEDDRYFIRVDDQRYELPDTIITGD